VEQHLNRKYWAQTLRLYGVNTARLSLKSNYMVGWVVRVSVAEQLERNPTLLRILLGFYRSTQPTFLGADPAPLRSYLMIKVPVLLKHH